jgi:hypothetical protein
METIKYYVIYNILRNGYYCERGVKSFWEPDVLKADRYKTLNEAKEVKRWFYKNEVEIKTITVEIR